MQPEAKAPGIFKVIAASAAGTLIEWYDFYIFGALAPILGAQLFPKDKELAGLLSTLAIFAVGFVVRPFGALVFGRLGDVAGRKATFLLTLMMMGGSTFAIGLVPGYATIGFISPLIVLVLRVLQGLALGGEYGGAATYVAEHAPLGRRGYYTSFIQTTATLGLFVSLLVILGTRTLLGEAEFAIWGWRIPFLLSCILVIFSYIIRQRMEESPLFAKIKSEGKTSSNPIKESFVNPANRRLVLLALFGATAGQGVVWYTGQFYALSFMQTIMHIKGAIANEIVAVALLIGTPCFILFGGLSDKIGRKKLIITGCALAAILYIPLYGAMKSSVPQTTDLGAAVVKIESHVDPVTKARTSSRVETWTNNSVEVVKKTPLETDGKPASPSEKPKIEVSPSLPICVTLSLLVLVQVLLVTLVYGPIAAFLVELFPVRIRYTSMSLPYHIGNGVFGGMVPLVATAAAAATKNDLAGLYYPIAVAAISAVIGAIFIHENKNEQGFEETT